LKRDVEKVHLSACSRSFLIENVWDKYLSMGTLHYVSVQHIQFNILLQQVSRRYETQRGHKLSLLTETQVFRCL
jgi:hypothetical protein